MSSKLSRHQQTVLILSLMATSIGQSLVFAILPPLGREVNLGELQITSIIALSSLVFSLASPRWGRFSDRVGRKPVIITGLVGYTMANSGTLREAFQRLSRYSHIIAESFEVRFEPGDE